MGSDLSCVYETRDAGRTWKPLTPNATANSIHFEPSRKTLFVTRWGERAPLLSSTDHGATWHPSDFGIRNGIAFLDSLRYVIANVNDAFLLADSVLITADGGKSWTSSFMPSETWQPVGIPGTSTIIMYSEREIPTRSRDAGVTWTGLQNKIETTGETEWCDCGQVVLAQALATGNASGMLFSSDEGESWIPFGGPSNNADTRFYYSGRYIYAASNDPGHLGEIWRYAVNHKPSLLSPALLRGCNPIDTLLHISFTNTCFGIPATLDSVAITGSTAFTMPGVTVPHVLQNEEDLAVHYTPRLGASDTAYIYLRFNQHGDVKDTTVRIIGVGADPPSTVQLAPKFDRDHAGVDEAVSLGVCPDRDVANTGLSSIHLDLALDMDLFHFDDAVSTTGTTVQVGTPVYQSGSTWLVPMDITGTDIDLHQDRPLVTLYYHTRLSDSTATSVSLHSATFTATDPTFQSCVLGVTTTDTRFSLDLTCGDSTLLNELRGGTPSFAIRSVYPNPATSELHVELTRLVASPIRYTLTNTLGEVVSRGSTEANTFTLSTTSHPTGTYYLRLEQGGIVVTRRVVIER